mgnify:CR=1 FL=1
MPPNDILATRAAGKVLVLDGATGTNLQARGLESGTLSENWVLEHPEKILQLHQDFIQAGGTASTGASTATLASAIIPPLGEQPAVAALLTSRPDGGKNCLTPTGPGHTSLAYLLTNSKSLMPGMLTTFEETTTSSLFEPAASLPVTSAPRVTV